MGVCPGPIDTQMAVANRRLVADLAGVTDDEAGDMLVSGVRMGRWGTADEVAQLVVFLASPAASHINGALIPIDGGVLPRSLLAEAERIGGRERPERARPWPERPVSAAKVSGSDTASARRVPTYPRSLFEIFVEGVGSGSA